MKQERTITQAYVDRYKITMLQTPQFNVGDVVRFRGVSIHGWVDFGNEKAHGHLPLSEWLALPVVKGE
jgi:hypothetical protein